MKLAHDKSSKKNQTIHHEIYHTMCICSLISPVVDEGRAHLIKEPFYEVVALTPISKTAGRRALGTKFGPPSRPPRTHELNRIEKKNMSRFGRV